MMHPFVLGKLACGNLKNRSEVLKLPGDLPAAPTATDDEALYFIERRALMGRVVGYIDVHFLAEAVLADDARIWTGGKRLADAAKELNVAFKGERTDASPQRTQRLAGGGSRPATQARQPPVRTPPIWSRGA